MTPNEVVERLGVDVERGLSDREVARRRSQVGRNTTLEPRAWAIALTLAALLLTLTQATRILQARQHHQTP